MTFLAPWALAIGALAAAGMVVLHLVARQRPAAYVLPTTRFVPDQRTLVSRAATRPRDLLLLLLRVLLVISAATAFARPVLTPSRGAIGRVVLLDRSRAVGNAGDAIARVRARVAEGAPVVLVAFDSIATVVAATQLDSLAVAPLSAAEGSLSAALVAARRASIALAEQVDSVQLVVVSPLAVREMDSATAVLRSQWPGVLAVERIALRTDTAIAWRLEHALPASDPLGPSTISLATTGSERVTRLTRAPFTSADSAFARDGGTVVRWDSTAAARPSAQGLSVGGQVVVASLGRTPATMRGRTIARWADGSAAASEASLGTGCLRQVGIAQPSAGDIALHPPFQAMVRELLKPCGVVAPQMAADSSVTVRLVGATTSAAPAAALRRDEDRTSPLTRWLLAFAMALLLAELFVRARPTPDEP